jgi:hypothetical protein
MWIYTSTPPIHQIYLLRATKGAHVEVVYHSALLILQVIKLFELLIYSVSSVIWGHAVA